MGVGGILEVFVFDLSMTLMGWVGYFNLFVEGADYSLGRGEGGGFGFNAAVTFWGGYSFVFFFWLRMGIGGIYVFLSCVGMHCCFPPPELLRLICLGSWRRSKSGVRGRGSKGHKRHSFLSCTQNSTDKKKSLPGNE